MTVPRALALTDRQLAIVRDQARRVPPPWRSRFLDDCADRLLAFSSITDDDVSLAAQRTLARFGMEPR
jgi:hypothetical protein